MFYLLINTPSRHFKQLTGVKLCPRRPLRPGVPRASRALWGAGLVGHRYRCGGIPVWLLGFAFSIGLSHESLVSANAIFSTL